MRAGASAEGASAARRSTRVAFALSPNTSCGSPLCCHAKMVAAPSCSGNQVVQGISSLKVQSSHLGLELQFHHRSQVDRSRFFDGFIFFAFSDTRFPCFVDQNRLTGSKVSKQPVMICCPKRWDRGLHARAPTRPSEGMLSASMLPGHACSAWRGTGYQSISLHRVPPVHPS